MRNNNGNNELEVKYGLPKDVIYCTKCVYSNQRPSSTVEFKNKKPIKSNFII